MSLSISNSNNFLPTKISGCQLWLDAADTSTISFSSGSNISVWADKSGNAKNATPLATAPTYSGSSVVFAGATMLNVAVQYPSLPTLTYFCVAAATSTNNMILIGANTEDIYQSGYQIVVINYVQYVYTFGGILINTGSNVGGSNVRFLYNGTLQTASTCICYLNGGQTSSGTAPTISGSASVTIGGYKNPGHPIGGLLWNGPMNEILI